MKIYFKQFIAIFLLKLTVVLPGAAIANEVEQIFSNFVFPSKIAITPEGMTILLPLGTSQKVKIVYVSTSEDLNNPATFSRTFRRCTRVYFSRYDG